MTSSTPSASSTGPQTAAHVLTAVRARYGAEQDSYGPEWAALAEFSLGPGGGHRRIDLFLVRAWGGKPRGHERISVEIKVSRADLLTELKHPEKNAQFRAVSHRFYLATPTGLTRPSDNIPREWGIIEVDPDGTCRTIQRGKRNPEPEPLPERSFVEAFRRAARADARVRDAARTVRGSGHPDDTDAGTDPGSGVATTDTAAMVVALRRERDTAVAAARRAKTAAARYRRQRDALLKRVAEHLDEWRCKCGLSLTPPRANRINLQPAHADGSRECRSNAPHARNGYAYPEFDLAGLADLLAPALEADDPGNT